MGDLIINLLILGGIGALLALLLEIAHAYLADYGEVTVHINEDTDLTVTGGSPLLFTLMDNGIFVPSACGGRGTCAYCKVRVLDGGGPVLPTETPYLTPEELGNNVRLSCQVKVRNDIAIAVPEELLSVQEFRVRVDRIEPLTPVINGLTLSILEPEDGIRFKPGQYIQLEVPAYELSKESDFRAFSLCSSSSRHMEVELFITKAPEGLVSIYVHDYLKVGGELTMRGPFGDFYFHDESDREVLLIATGSGLAPIRSILLHMEEEKIGRKATLFFGGRKPQDLYQREELEALEKNLPDFTFMPVLSRCKEEDNWEGEQGRVTDLINKYIPDNAELDVYICGNPKMVDSCQKRLMEKGVPEEHIYFDKFA